MSHTLQNNYDRIASFYDRLSDLYSGGQIRACKGAQMRDIRPGARVLYAGVGGGEDAVMAAQKAAHVTVVDLSARMLTKAAERMAAAGLEGQVESIHGDVLAHDRREYYDVVCANFFLNVFSEHVMRAAMRHLASLLRPEGKLLIADFAPVEGPALQRMVRRMYFGAAVVACRFAAGNALHPIYDYRVHLDQANLRPTQSTSCGRFFCTLTAVPK
jgi:demethylmenaquinone methyltransferase/2-methoxy-6-polyprenyl-1,4-benzoquinol methylase